MCSRYGTGMEIVAAAQLIGEPARAAMLDALLGGEPLAAGELARVAGVRAATASEHLARLRAGGLVEVVPAGRHRYYRLASPDVGQALEALSLLGSLAPVRPVRSLRGSRAAAAFALARTCYDHLAGQVGVAVHDALVSGGALVPGGDGYELTVDGARLLAGIGVDVAAARATRRQFARPCLDYTQRTPHLAGALGAALCSRLMALGWLVRRRGERGLGVTDVGRAMIWEHFRCQSPENAPRS
jgi:DNA-binding transcriptional ArsR family regulator